MLAVLSVSLMVVDARFDYLEPVRSKLGMVLTPFYGLAEMPVRAWEGVRDQFSSRSELIAENERLKAESLLMQRRVQKLAALTEQNVRLRELLNSAALVDDKVLVSELIGVDPNPFTQRIMIDKGENDGVFVGQPVLDASGLMGQVVEVMPYTARVLLLTDTTHSIPVQVNRNGLRAIAVGTGNPERLELRYVADTADIKEGDLLVSSGLGQRFPAGYPVATVKEVIHDSGQPFAVVRAVPTAKMNRSRYVLLVFSDSRTPEQRANDAALVKEFDWIMYVFGAFLLFSGVKMLFNKHEEEPDLEHNPVLRFLRKHMRVTKELHEHHFFVRLPDASGKLVRYATPLFFALVLIELADLVFAVDSVPAIFAITQDPFIVYTSNIFAILGLRALYFSLAAMIHRFVYLKYALALVLVFIGAKIMLHGVIGKIPAGLSLGVTFGLLAGGILLSLLKTRTPKATVEDKAEPNAEHALDRTSGHPR